MPGESRSPVIINVVVGFYERLANVFNKKKKQILKIINVGQ